jgi:hypothetical protein
MSHTKGKWTTLSKASGNVNYVNSCKVVCESEEKEAWFEIIDTRQGGYVGMAGKERESNAQLISAAPDMLEALEDLAKDYENLLMELGHDPDGSHQFINAKQAVKKAKGERSE